MLGDLSKKYESNGESGCISSGLGDAGGKSYGMYQMSSRYGVVNDYVQWLYNNGYWFAENQSAGDAVDRADERAAEAADINKRVTEQLAGSKELLSEIRADNQRAKQLIAELITGAESGRTQGEKN